jgi:hypothetical protein
MENSAIEEEFTAKVDPFGRDRMVSCSCICRKRLKDLLSFVQNSSGKPSAAASAPKTSTCEPTLLCPPNLYEAVPRVLDAAPVRHSIHEFVSA